MAANQPISIKTIGVIGAGQMGSGIAHVAALAGYEVRLNDISAAALEKALVGIDKNIARQIARGKATEADKSAALKRIKTGTGFEFFKECDVVIEAATEKEDLKHEIFK